MEKRLILLLGENDFLGQAMCPWESMDVAKIIDNFARLGYKIMTYQYHELFNKNIELKNETIIYSSSQREFYKGYINDQLLELNNNNRLLPRYELFHAHDNKGYQEIIKKKIGLQSINALYFGCLEELSNYSLVFPKVFKSINGASSEGVFLVENERDVFLAFNAINQIDKFKKVVMLWEKLKTNISLQLKRKNAQHNQQCKLYYLKKQFHPFVIQDFIEGLEFDYKVLVFFDKYYVLKRYIRKNDFRASGSGLFEFEKVEPSLLDFADTVFNKLDCPVVSLDICFNGKNYYLIEFQALHFGPYTLNNSNGYYSKINENWVFVEQKSVLEDSFCESIVKYIEK